MFIARSSDAAPAQKLRIAATILLGFVAITAVVWPFQGCSKPATGIQQVEELGSGFRRAIIAKSEKGQLKYYPFFFYRDRPLCQIGPTPPSISPSGNFAVCQDVRTGKLMLFRRRDEKIIPLTSSSFGIPSGFVWHEEEGTVEVGVGKEGLASIFSLR